jgi:hypothetical protein
MDDLLARDLTDPVQVPEAARPAAPRPEPARDRRPEAREPRPHRLVGDDDAALGEQLLDVAQAQREPGVQPHRVLDDRQWEAVPARPARAHAAALPAAAAVSNPADLTTPTNAEPAPGSGPGRRAGPVPPMDGASGARSGAGVPTQDGTVGDGMPACSARWSQKGGIRTLGPRAGRNLRLPPGVSNRGRMVYLATSPPRRLAGSLDRRGASPPRGSRHLRTTRGMRSAR